MTSRSTKENPIIGDLHGFDRRYYYVKRRSIVEKISFDHRTFYAKFERIDEPLTDTVIKQHLDRQYTIAVPLIKEGKSNYLVIEYRGSQPLRFYHMSRHLMHTFQIESCFYFQGKKENYIQLFIPVEALALDEADEMVGKISDALETKMPKEWKCFPDKTLPESYNIVTLPYAVYPS